MLKRACTLPSMQNLQITVNGDIAAVCTTNDVDALRREWRQALEKALVEEFGKEYNIYVIVRASLEKVEAFTYHFRMDDRSLPGGDLQDEDSLVFRMNHAVMLAYASLPERLLDVA
jgi:hypothetical protein